MSNDHPVWYSDEMAPSSQALINRVLAVQAELDQARVLIRELQERGERQGEALALAKMEAAGARQHYERVLVWLQRAQTKCALAEQGLAGLRAALTGDGHG